MSKTKVAVVTGSNKGIGFAIVRGLCKNFKGDVYVTARDVGRGEEAVQELKKEGLNAKFHQLDITDHSSIEGLKDHLKQTYGGLDILVNNAGMAYKQNSTTPFSEQAEITCKTNFLGTLDCCNVLFPLLRPHARVVNVSSFVSKMVLDRCSTELRSQILAVKTIDDIKNILEDFVKATKAGNHKEKGYPESAYGMSKVGVTAMSIIQQEAMNSDPREDIIINACCPGHVATDMTSYGGKLSVDQGAETPLYLALLPPGTTSPKGKMISEKKIIPWQ